MVKRRSDKLPSLHQSQNPAPASAAESDADPFPLVGRRGKTRAECLEIISRSQEAIQAPLADESEAVDAKPDYRGDALAAHGFPRDWWLPVSLAREWQTDNYPKELAAASVQQWLDLCDKVCRANLGADQLSADGSFRERAEKFRRYTAADCEILRTHLVDLLRETHPPDQLKKLKAVWEVVAAHLRTNLAAVSFADHDAKGKEPRHSIDFRSVDWFGTLYHFTPAQAVVVKVLWEAWENGTPDVGGETLTDAAGSDKGRLVDLFKSEGKPHKAWGAIIVSGETKGSYRLQELGS